MIPEELKKKSEFLAALQDRTDPNKKHGQEPLSMKIAPPIASIRAKLELAKQHLMEVSSRLKNCKAWFLKCSQSLCSPAMQSSAALFPRTRPIKTRRRSCMSIEIPKLMRYTVDIS